MLYRCEPHHLQIFRQEVSADFLSGFATETNSREDFLNIFFFSKLGDVMKMAHSPSNAGGG